MGRALGRLVETGVQEKSGPTYWVEVTWEDGQTTTESLWRCYKRHEGLMKRKDREGWNSPGKQDKLIIERAERLYPTRFRTVEEWLTEIVRDIRIFPPGEHGSVKGDHIMPKDSHHAWRCAERLVWGWLSLEIKRIKRMAYCHELKAKEAGNRLGFTSNNLVEQQAVDGNVDLVKILSEKGA